jgi:hypothetical protein
MGYNVTKEQLLKAIENSQGLVTKIQKNLEKMLKTKICWDTVKKYLGQYPECEVAIQAEKEAMLDLAENNVFKELARGDASMSKWYLKMKGQERGYIETQEIKMGNNDPLNINLNTQSAEELKSSSMVEVGDGAEETGSTE